MPNPTSRGFLAVSKEDVVIQRGDVVHVDFGITYMGLNTDWQKEAYVLLPGEKDAPEGLKRALKNTNELQDVVTTKARPGLLPGDLYNAAMDAMEKKRNRSENLQPSNWQSGPRSGPQYRLPVRERGDIGVSQAQPFRKGCYTSIELNTVTPVPEWDGQKLFVMMEDDAYLTDDGYKFFVPRQEAFYLVK